MRRAQPLLRREHQPFAQPLVDGVLVRDHPVVPNEAAALLGVSRDFFDEYVKPELRIIRRGRKTILIPIAELERWVVQSAAPWND